MAGTEDSVVTLTLKVDTTGLDKAGKTIKVTFDPEQVQKFTKAVRELRSAILDSASATSEIAKNMSSMTRHAGVGIRTLIQQVKELNEELKVSGGGGGGGGGRDRPPLPYRSTTFGQAIFASVATGGMGAPSAFQQAAWTYGLRGVGAISKSLAGSAVGRGLAGVMAKIPKTPATIGVGIGLGASGLAWHGWTRGNQLANTFLAYQRQRLESSPFVDPGTLLGPTSGYGTGQPLGYTPGESLGMVTQASLGMYRGFDNDRERQLMFSAARARGITPGAFGGFMGAAERTGTPRDMSASLAGRTIVTAGHKRGLGLQGQAVVDHFQENLAFLQAEAASGHSVYQNNLLGQQVALGRMGVPGHLATGITQDYAKAQQRVGMHGMHDALDVRMMRAFGYKGTGGPQEFARILGEMQSPGKKPEAMHKYFSDLLAETGTRGTPLGTLTVQRAILEKQGNISWENAQRIAMGIDKMSPAELAKIGEEIGGWDGSGLQRDASKMSDRFGHLQRLAGIEGLELGTGASFVKNMLDLRKSGDNLAGAAERMITKIDALTGAIESLTGWVAGDSSNSSPDIPVKPMYPGRTSATDVWYIRQESGSHGAGQRTE